MKRLPLVSLLASLAAACGVDFSAPLLDTGARLTVHLELVDSLGVGQARVSGNLWPGFNEVGSVRVLADSSLELLGRTVVPVRANTATLQGIPYSEQWGLDPDIPPVEVALRAPDIPGIGEAPPVLRLTPPWRAGPGDVIVAAGSGLRLDLLTQPDSTVRESWTLDLRNDLGQEVSRISSNGPTPSGIDVPWPLLAGLGGGGGIRLTVQQWAQGPAGTRYSAALLVTTQHVWSVTVQP